MKHYLKQSAIALAALASMSAQAVVITFDQPIDTTNAPLAPLLPYTTAGTEIVTQGFWFDPYSAVAGRQDGDLVGALIDGADSANICSALTCPTNATGTYLAGLNDGYLIFGAVDGSPLRLTSFSASFIGAQGDTLAAVPGILRISAVSAANATLATVDFNLAGLNGAGALSFATFSNTGALATTNAAFYRVRAAYCDTTGACSFTSTNKGQWALDNINVTAVPEPSQWALFGLGLAGVAAIARRRRAA